MARNKNEERPIDYPRDKRAAGWSEPVRSAVSRILLASLGIVIGLVGWLSSNSVSHDVDIAVLNESRVKVDAEQKEQNNRLMNVELNQARNDESDRINQKRIK